MPSIVSPGASGTQRGRLVVGVLTGRELALGQPLFADSIDGDPPPPAAQLPEVPAADEGREREPDPPPVAAHPRFIGPSLIRRSVHGGDIFNLPAIDAGHLHPGRRATSRNESPGSTNPVSSTMRPALLSQYSASSTRTWMSERPGSSGAAGQPRQVAGVPQALEQRRIVDERGGARHPDVAVVGGRDERDVDRLSVADLAGLARCPRRSGTRAKPSNAARWATIGRLRSRPIPVVVNIATGMSSIIDATNLDGFLASRHFRHVFTPHRLRTCHCRSHATPVARNAPRLHTTGREAGSGLPGATASRCP